MIVQLYGITTVDATTDNSLGMLCGRSAPDEPGCTLTRHALQGFRAYRAVGVRGRADRREQCDGSV